jgi:hypothetical protein
MKAKRVAQDFEVDPDCWETLMTWLRVQTQWRTGASGVIGLDYVAVDVVLRRYRASDDVFEGLQIMERAALREMNKD